MLVHAPVPRGIIIAISSFSTVGAALVDAHAGSSPRRTLARLVRANNAINNESR